MNNNNSRTNETLASNVLLSSMSLAEDGKILCLKANVIKVKWNISTCTVQVLALCCGADRHVDKNLQMAEIDHW